jgi:AraC family transcriptional regulator of adaptative response/methylated-DNA-[protein]-cysteine methyltransferase
MQDMIVTLASEPATGDAQSLDRRWQAVVERDRLADGAFFFSVETTGVYCRPSCGARRPNRENVRFHDSAAAAEAAGYRACKRCRPGETDRNAALVARACRMLANAEGPHALAELSAEIGISPFHFHRIFKAATGVTPKAYGDAIRANRARTALGQTKTVTDAIYDAGYSSSGRFYEASAGILGMTPTRFRAGGAGETLHYGVGRCSLGAILVAATDKGIAAIEIGDSEEALLGMLRMRLPAANLVAGGDGFARQLEDVIALVEQPALGLDLPLDIRGTAFQHRVWQALRGIPLGQTASYADIAERIGAPSASRAVARACAANPLAVAIPCHRVVRKDSALSRYRWGVERKRALLEREGG